MGLLDELACFREFDEMSKNFIAGLYREELQKNGKDFKGSNQTQINRDYDYSLRK